ncbi:Rec8 like protein-domain-containing protein [Phaeosphaeria sp. MPI-PUGE-AT-0046c]|nr:Rec8 like protein-domain-containing protein [Phaeosphaeria sp. MPI-PUGE-AT-0046c]
MFYSHEVLTSRKYGVATVWLVATLGSKSSLKRIKRKQILDVDVAKACQTIVDPVAPMALRLQGNLLYGVTRVYLQQCGYVQSDAQNAHNSMLMLLRTVENHALDPAAGKARPEQLMLQDDPSFLPDFALAPPANLTDLDGDFNFNISHSGESQSLTPFGSQKSYSSSQAGPLGGLVLPSSSPTPAGGFQLHGDTEGAGTNQLPIADHGMAFDEPDFAFDENGELVESLLAPVVAGTPAGRSRAAMHSDADASAKVRRDHEEGRMGGALIPGDDMYVNLPILGDELPDAEAFPTAGHPGSDEVEVIQSTSTVSAPMQRKWRAPRVLPIDTRMELRNKDLADWNANYLQNMDTILKTKKQGRAGKQAKKNAEYLVWGRGLGGIAEHYAGVTGPNPFEMFIGDNLFELATGIDRRKKGTKHDRDSGIDEATQEQARRVRQKTGEPEHEMGRGAEDDPFFPGGDEVEMPREAAPALDDQQIFSSMPWNISASKHGSSALPRSRLLGGPSSDRPGSRMVSASPLHGRGQPLGLEVLQSLESDGDFGGYGAEPSSPPTMVPSPAKPSLRVNEAMSGEGDNFLGFVTRAIVQKRDDAQATLDPMAGVQEAEEAGSINAITFEELLPPRQNGRMTACQGIMMVLSLGTKGMLDVQQAEDFGEIELKLTERAKASQVVEIGDSSDVDEGEVEGEAGGGEDEDGDVEMQEEEIEDGDEEEGEEGGQFEEQFAAERAQVEEDSEDELNAA